MLLCCLLCFLNCGVEYLKINQATHFLFSLLLNSHYALLTFFSIFQYVKIKMFSNYNLITLITKQNKNKPTAKNHHKDGEYFFSFCGG